jgi:hypothetical protein
MAHAWRILHRSLAANGFCIASQPIKTDGTKILIGWLNLNQSASQPINGASHGALSNQDGFGSVSVNRLIWCSGVVV